MVADLCVWCNYFTNEGAYICEPQTSQNGVDGVHVDTPELVTTLFAQESRQCDYIFQRHGGVGIGRDNHAQRWFCNREWFL